MTLSLHDVAVPTFRQILGGLSKVLDKAEAHFAASGADTSAVMASRLYADMAPFTFQVQQAIGHSAGALAKLRGEDFATPGGLDSFAGQKAALAQALAYVNATTPADLEGAETRQVVFKFPGGEMPFVGQAYLITFALPNFYFHVTTAYGLLRHAGVPIGKRDFLGG